ncbi:uncharacterized GMC-type oxidoreductase Mb1310 [Folsomia candida]|uniref:uncharacterized GMC-type oxidoreductase Mb1310 n=1 Tax=Folsomia candida TaxID=158441 RepID=UPI001604B699|nr:uncharacterized GMC-type oxidoreductase Mb1310 [Folsomia candida]
MTPRISSLRLGTQAVFRQGRVAPRLIPVDFAVGLHLSWPLLSALISILILMLNSWEWAFQKTDFLQTISPRFFDPYLIEEFDFVIVGGGSAGTIVANRLSKYPGNSVLLLEAGGKPNPFMLWPAMAYVGQLKVPGVDWMYETVPQKNTSLGLTGKKVRIPRGKGLGGSSNLNLMYYQRGNKRDYDRWADVTGDEEWNFENVMPFFKSSSNYHGHNPNPIFHRTVSPTAPDEGLFVGQTIPYGIREWLSAAAEKGYHVEDPNALQRESFGRMDVTIKDGQRFGTYAAFLQGKVEARRNLWIYLYSRAIKVHLDKDRVAYGVTYRRHGKTRFVRARKEIILSAGAVDTPRLLLLSGIGPKRELNELGISCRVNLPVGYNLQDHALTIVGPFTVDDNKAASFLRESNAISLSDYFGRNMGFISTPDSSSGVGYVCSSLAEKDWPDIQYTLIGASTTIPIVSMAHNFKPGLWEAYSKPYLTRDSFAVAIVAPGLPRSRGQIRLASSSPDDKPIIDPHYFTHPDDMRIMTDGMRILIDLIETTQAYRKIGASFATTPLPGCEHFSDLRSNEYYECYLRQLTFTVHHPSCTVPMGKDWRDQRTVLDSKLRVFKTRHLRVIDASVMPYIPNANLNAPTIMIGEKAAHFIRDYWAQQFLVCDMREFLSYRENRQCFYCRLV